MATAWAADRRGWFYLGLALAAYIAIAIGFSTTYFGPMARGELAVPPIVHGHGLSAFAWVTLFATQALLGKRGDIRLHMRLGWAGIPVAVAVWATGILTNVWAARRDLPTQGVVAETSFMGTVTGLSMFLLMVVAATVLRKRPAAHKRLMALATIAVLWPAVFRWRHLLPPVDRPEILFGLLIPNIPIVIAMFRDRFRYGQVHPVWLVLAPIWFVEQSIETLVFDTNWSAPMGHWLLSVLP